MQNVYFENRSRGMKSVSILKLKHKLEENPAFKLKSIELISNDKNGCFESLKIPVYFYSTLQQ